MSDDPLQHVESSESESDSRPPIKTQQTLAGSASTIEPAKRLIEVMGPNLVRALAIGSVLGAAALCLVGIFLPTLIPGQTSRFLFCVLTAFFFSVFVFALYPTDYKINIRDKFQIPIVLVGPAALWIGLLLLFLRMFPSPDTAGKVFVPVAGSDQLAYSTTWVLGWDPIRPVYYKLKLSDDQDSNNPNLPAGFYVQFDEAHTKYTATIGIGPTSEEIKGRYEVVFTRDASTYKLKQLSDKGDERR